MRRLSLSAQLTIIFVAVTTACFILVGLLLYGAATRRVYEQDETNLVLSARHIRRLTAELDSVSDLRAHQDRIVINVLGDPNNAVRIVDAAGRILVEHNPTGYPIEVGQIVPAGQRILADMLHSWHGADGMAIRGLAVEGALRDGAHVTIVVARSLADRQRLLRRYGRDMALRLLAGLLAAILLSHLLVKRALRPLRTMATEAATINAHNLSTRLSTGNAPAELHALSNALNDMLGRLESGFARVWQFTVDLAHDLRTPIGNLRGTNEVALARPRTPAEYQAILGSNIEECDRVSRMIENVLFLARADNPQFALQRVTFDVGEELRRIVDYFDGIASEAGISIDAQSAARAYADRDLFRRAVGNLLSNALRYTPAGESIRIRAEESNGMTRVTVENPGTVIPPEHLERLFDRFYRADRSRSNSADSAGLGLSIVKSIVELHDGRVTAESAHPGVTRFTLWFPSERDRSD